MPDIIYPLTFLIPVTYFIEILRGIVLRGADFFDLLPFVIGLSLCCAVVLTVSVARFRKQLGQESIGPGLPRPDLRLTAACEAAIRFGSMAGSPVAPLEPPPLCPPRR